MRGSEAWARLTQSSLPRTNAHPCSLTGLFNLTHTLPPRRAMRMVQDVLRCPAPGEAWAAPAHPHLPSLAGMLVNTRSGHLSAIMDYAPYGSLDTESLLEHLVPPAATVRRAGGREGGPGECGRCCGGARSEEAARAQAER